MVLEKKLGSRVDDSTHKTGVLVCLPLGCRGDGVYVAWVLFCTVCVKTLHTNKTCKLESRGRQACLGWWPVQADQGPDVANVRPSKLAATRTASTGPQFTVLRQGATPMHQPDMPMVALAGNGDTDRQPS